ncbi:hypothetical protein MLD38_028164 [Melastoma candidum]|uniref:Uncharacterized protein n=1 Tax=Melastoma candidum TaxID=119954 RepID=A0ACB9N4G5_9MYRT|nr:hypothetical protein MLD38_028164 [Melastoma candidum]
MAAVSIAAALNPAFNRPKFPSSPSPSPSPLSIPSNRRRRFSPLLRPLLASPPASPPPPSSPGLYSSVQLDLTIKNVDLVLDDVRPYLIADGGNVEVVSVDDGVVSLKLQGNFPFFVDLIASDCRIRVSDRDGAASSGMRGCKVRSLCGLVRVFRKLIRRRFVRCFQQPGVVAAHFDWACGTCPSSTTTMQMGIERVLKEKFGEAVKEIRQVFDEEPSETSAEAVNRHLDILRPAISNYGGSVEVLSVKGGECLVKYVGPESIGSGIKAAIKEKFPDITDVNFTG